MDKTTLNVAAVVSQTRGLFHKAYKIILNQKYDRKMIFKKFSVSQNHLKYKIFLKFKSAQTTLISGKIILN